MADPTTANIQLYQPARGSNVGGWDLPENANEGATDSLFANVATISLTNANVTLSTPPNSGAAWAGPYQSQSALLRFIGTLTGNPVITIPRAGFFMIENLCLVGSYFVQIESIAPGKIICAPPGEIVHILCDGTDCKYLDLGRIGQLIDLAVTSVPPWITNSTVPPYLNCDGSTFSAGTYPALNALLGGTTLPDFRGRTRAALNQTTSRITTAGSGVDGNTLFAAGGTENVTIAKANIPNYNLPVTDLGHDHTISQITQNLGSSGIAIATALTPGGVHVSTSTTGITVASGGSGAALGTMNPVAICGLTLIRAA